MKDFGKLKYFLRIEVSYSKQGIFASQRNYMLELLKLMRKPRSKASCAPIVQNHKLGERQEGKLAKKGIKDLREG